MWHCAYRRAWYKAYMYAIFYLETTWKGFYWPFFFVIQNSLKPRFYSYRLTLVLLFPFFQVALPRENTNSFLYYVDHHFILCDFDKDCIQLNVASHPLFFFQHQKSLKRKCRVIFVFRETSHDMQSKVGMLLQIFLFELDVNKEGKWCIWWIPPLILFINWRQK